MVRVPIFWGDIGVDTDLDKYVNGWRAGTLRQDPILKAPRVRGGLQLNYSPRLFFWDDEGMRRVTWGERGKFQCSTPLKNEWSI